MKELRIHTDYIELQNALKLLGIISTGGSAKAYLSINTVIVNNEEENRRGRKLYDKDILTVENVSYKIIHENK